MGERTNKEILKAKNQIYIKIFEENLLHLVREVLGEMSCFQTRKKNRRTLFLIKSLVNFKNSTFGNFHQ